MKTQVYSLILNQIKEECLSGGTLWTDPEFGPNDIALWEGAPKIQGITWKRPRVC